MNRVNNYSTDKARYLVTGPAYLILNWLDLEYRHEDSTCKKYKYNTRKTAGTAENPAAHKYPHVTSL